MKKIELSALESKNMTAAPEEIVMEVNGGCTWKYKMVYTCGGSTMDWVQTAFCGGGCPKGAVRHFKKFYQTSATTVYSKPFGKLGSSYVWRLSIYSDFHNSCTNLKATNNNPYGWESCAAGN